MIKPSQATSSYAGSASTAMSDLVPGATEHKTIIKDATLKARIRQLRFVVRTLDFTCSLLVIITCGHALRLYYASLSLQNTTTTNSTPWPSPVDTRLQVFLLVVAILSFTLNASIMFAYFGGHNTARLAGRAKLGFQIIASVVFLALWAGTTGALQTLRNGTLGNGRALWIQSCSQWKKTDPVDYQSICWSTNWAVGCGWVSTSLTGLMIILLSLSLFRYTEKRSALRAEQEMDKAEILALKNYHARGLQSPSLVSEMTRGSSSQTIV